LLPPAPRAVVVLVHAASDAVASTSTILKTKGDRMKAPRRAKADALRGATSPIDKIDLAEPTMSY
jgi:hypothetical protein